MKDFMEYLKLPPTILATISIVTGCIMFLPESILADMGLNKIGNPYNMIIGIVFLLSTALVIMYIVKDIYERIKDHRFNKRFPAMFEKIMSELSDEEKVVVYILNSEPDKTTPLPMGSGVTLRLTTKMVIQRTTNIAFTGPELEMPHTLTPAALKYLKDHPYYLDGISNAIQNLGIS